MPWTLDIWHIDVESSGDATLIVASHDGKGGMIAAQKRSALIDGGRAGKSSLVHHVIANRANLSALDVMVTTHYDEDHFGGIRSLLGGKSSIYDNTRLYDQGEQGTLDSVKRTASGAAKAAFLYRDDKFIDYLQKVDARPRATRVTEGVLSDGATPQGQSQAKAKKYGKPPDWLVGKEILWNGAVMPKGAPTLTCVAANQWVINNGGNASFVTSSLLAGDHLKNAKSLAFLLQFGNFKYYVGGDILAVQEDGSQWNGVSYTVTQANRTNSLMQYLNQTNDPAGRVHAFKTSHHGSKYSSAPAFLARLRARAAFISCGTDNQYDHPDQQVVNALEKDPTVVGYFITGENLRGTANLGVYAQICGVWVPASNVPTDRGDARLTITEAQAGNASAAVPFSVLYARPNAGSNIGKNPNFAYTPSGSFVTNF